MTAATLSALLALSAGTLVSEDLAGVTAGFLVAEGRLALTPAVVAVWAGIWAGDVGLWIAGRFFRRTRRDHLVTRHPATAILTSRFLPGTRLAVYVAAGAAGVPFTTFAAWSALATAVWTPLLVGLSAIFGRAVDSVLHTYFGVAWFLLPLAVLLVWRGEAILRTAQAASSRLGRWEFWPAWLFYAPVVPWVAYLVATRGSRALFAANPGLEDGGFVGESKSGILSALPEPWVLRHALIQPGEAASRAEALRVQMSAPGWSFPIVLKPDVGQRGDGVQLVGDPEAARLYLATYTGPVVAQVYHAGPYEAGIFYYKRPGEARGRIFSLTDKQFPHVVGDGRTPLASLIRQHRRYRIQAPMFLARFSGQLARVPKAGERVLLGVTGNHAKGAIFLDGSDLVTEALTARIDEIARAVDGFFIGRFDVRYSDPGAFMAGRDLAIVELNGVSSEATHIYDPSRSLLDAYRTLYQQWRLVFEIGAANIRSGHRTQGLARLLRLSAEHVMGV